MKNLLIVLAIAITLPLNAQDDDGYVMFQSISLKAKEGQGQQLNAALEAHNDKYHQEGAEAVNVWAVRSGPRTGTMLWVKGPRTWTDMDTPLEADGHMDDWRSNVVPNSHMGPWEFWKLVDGMSYMPEGFTPGLAFVRYFDIKSQKGDNARRHWNSIIKLYNENNWDIGIQIYNNQVPSGDGHDWAIMWFYENWASMDKSRGFFDKFEEMYGLDRNDFFEEWNASAEFKGAEIFELMKKLSASASDE